MVTDPGDYWLTLTETCWEMMVLADLYTQGNERSIAAARTAGRKAERAARMAVRAALTGQRVNPDTPPCLTPKVR